MDRRKSMRIFNSNQILLNISNCFADYLSEASNLFYPYVRIQYVPHIKTHGAHTAKNNMLHLFRTTISDYSENHITEID